MTSHLDRRPTVVAGRPLATIDGEHTFALPAIEPRLQLQRQPKTLPTLALNPSKSDLFGWDYEDFTLTNYVSDAHIKASLTGASVVVPFEEGQLLLGRWQGIFLCEFDGPRERSVYVTALK